MVEEPTTGGGSSVSSPRPNEQLTRAEKNRLYRLLAEYWQVSRVLEKYAELYPGDRLPANRTVYRLRKNRKLADLIAERKKQAIIEGYGPAFRRLLDMSRMAEAWNDLFYRLHLAYIEQTMGPEHDDEKVPGPKLDTLALASKTFLSLLAAIQKEQTSPAPGIGARLGLPLPAGGGRGPTVVVQSEHTTIDLDWPDFQSYEEVVGQTDAELMAVFEKMLQHTEEMISPGQPAQEGEDDLGENL